MAYQPPSLKVMQKQLERLQKKGYAAKLETFDPASDFFDEFLKEVVDNPQPKNIGFSASPSSQTRSRLLDAANKLDIPVVIEPFAVPANKYRLYSTDLDYKAAIALSGLATMAKPWADPLRVDTTSILDGLYEESVPIYDSSVKPYPVPSSLFGTDQLYSIPAEHRVKAQVFINKRDSSLPRQIDLTLAHELGHVVLGHPQSNNPIDVSLREFQADAVSYGVLKKIGVANNPILKQQYLDSIRSHLNTATYQKFRNFPYSEFKGLAEDAVNQIIPDSTESLKLVRGERIQPMVTSNKKINTGTIATSANEPSRPKLTSDIIADYLERMGGQATLVKPDGSQYNPNRKGRVNIGDRMTTAEKFGQAADVGLSNEFQKLPEVHARFDDRQVALQVQKELATGRLTTQKFFESPDKAIADQAAEEIRRSDGLLGRGEAVEVRKLGKVYEVVAVKQYQPVPSRGNSAVRSYGLDNDPEGRFVAFNKPEEAYAAPKSLKELQAEARRLEASGTQALAPDTRTEFKPQAQSNWEKLELPTRSPMTEQLLQVAPEPRAIAAQTLDTPSDAWKLPQAKEPKLPHFYAQMASGDNPLGTGSTVQSEYNRSKSAYEGYQRFGYAPADTEFPALRDIKKLAESEGVKGDDALKAYIKGKQNAPLIEAGVLPKPELPMTARLGQEYISPKTGKVATIAAVGRTGVKMVDATGQPIRVEGAARPDVIPYKTLEKLKYTGNKQYGFATPAVLTSMLGTTIGVGLGFGEAKRLAKNAGWNEDQQNLAGAAGGFLGGVTGVTASTLPFAVQEGISGKPLNLRMPTAKEMAINVLLGGNAVERSRYGTSIMPRKLSTAERNANMGVEARSPFRMDAIAPETREYLRGYDPDFDFLSNFDRPDTRITSYTNDGYVDINNSLRSKNPTHELQGAVADIQRSLASMPSYEGTAYRGIPTDDLHGTLKSLGITGRGSIFADPAFTSFSREAFVAEQFAGDYNDRIILETQSRGGSVIDPYSSFGSNEAEVLFPAGYRQKVDDVLIKEADGRLTAYVQLSDLPESAKYFKDGGLSAKNKAIRDSVASPENAASILKDNFSVQPDRYLSAQFDDFGDSLAKGASNFEFGQKFISPKTGGVASLSAINPDGSIVLRNFKGKEFDIPLSRIGEVDVKPVPNIDRLRNGDGIVRTAAVALDAAGNEITGRRLTVTRVLGDRIKAVSDIGEQLTLKRSDLAKNFAPNPLGFVTYPALNLIAGASWGSAFGYGTGKALAKEWGWSEDQQNLTGIAAGVIGSATGGALGFVPTMLSGEWANAPKSIFPRTWKNTLAAALLGHPVSQRRLGMTSETGAIQPANPVVMKRQADRLKAQGYDVKLETFNPTQGWMDEYVTEVQKAPQGSKNILGVDAPFDDGSIRKRLVDSADRMGIVVKQADGSISDILPKPNNLELAPNQRLRGTAYVDPKTKAQTIAVDAAFPKFGVDNTIAHEMGHILAGHTDGSRSKLSSTLKELEANAVAYGVQKKLGVAGNPRLQDAYLERYRSHLNMRQYQGYRSQIGNIDSERVQKAVDAILPYSVESQRLVRGERSQPVAIAPEITAKSTSSAPDRFQDALGDVRSRVQILPEISSEQLSMFEPPKRKTGLLYLPNYLTIADQKDLLNDLRTVVKQSPLFIPTMSSGVPFKYKMTNIGDLGWISDRQGYRYESKHPVTGQPYPEIPSSLRSMIDDLSGKFGEKIRPDAVLLNWYSDGAKLGLHVDNTEKVSKPVVSLSLGDRGVFAIDTTGSRDRSTAMRNLERINVNSGDAIVFGGDLRNAYHSVERIDAGTAPAALGMKNSGRINLTARQVQPDFVAIAPEIENIMTSAQADPEFARSEYLEQKGRGQPPKQIGLFDAPDDGKFPLKKIISGGQTGADQVGLEVAKKFGIDTGGFAPPRFMTEAGQNMALRDDYGLTDIKSFGNISAEMAQRTRQNARAADGTVIFTEDINSKGTQRTIKEVGSRPLLVNPESPQQLRDFIQENRIATLNVAGNRASKAGKDFPDRVRSTLTDAIAPVLPTVDESLKGRTLITGKGNIVRYEGDKKFQLPDLSIRQVDDAQISRMGIRKWGDLGFVSSVGNKNLPASLRGKSNLEIGLRGSLSYPALNTGTMGGGLALFGYAGGRLLAKQLGLSRDQEEVAGYVGGTLGGATGTALGYEVAYRAAGVDAPKFRMPTAKEVAARVLFGSKGKPDAGAIYAIGGSRKLAEAPEIVNDVLRKAVAGDATPYFVLGDAKGGDAIAKQFAIDNDIPYRVMAADKADLGNLRYIVRDYEVPIAAKQIAATGAYGSEIKGVYISADDSKGTQHMINAVMESGIPAELTRVKSNIPAIPSISDPNLSASDRKLLDDYIASGKDPSNLTAKDFGKGAKPELQILGTAPATIDEKIVQQKGRGVDVLGIASQYQIPQSELDAMTRRSQSPTLAELTGDREISREEFARRFPDKVSKNAPEATPRQSTGASYGVVERPVTIAEKKYAGDRQVEIKSRYDNASPDLLKVGNFAKSESGLTAKVAGVYPDYVKLQLPDGDFIEIDRGSYLQNYSPDESYLTPKSSTKSTVKSKSGFRQALDAVTDALYQPKKSSGGFNKQQPKQGTFIAESAVEASAQASGATTGQVKAEIANQRATGQAPDLDRATAAAKPQPRSLKQMQQAASKAVSTPITGRIGRVGDLGIKAFDYGSDITQAAQTFSESVNRGESGNVAALRAATSVGSAYGVAALANMLPIPAPARLALTVGGSIAAAVGGDKAIDSMVGRDAAREEKYGKDLSKLGLAGDPESELLQPFGKAGDRDYARAYGNALVNTATLNMSSAAPALGRSLANLANSQSIDNARYASERGQSIDLSQQVGAGRRQMTGPTSTVYRDRGDGVTEAIGRRRAFSDTESRVLALQNLANESGYEVPRTGKFDPKLSEALEKLGYGDRQIGDYIQGRSKTIGSPAAKQSNQQQAKQQFALRSKLGKVTSSQMSEALSAERKARGLKGDQKLDQGTVDSVFSSLAGRSLSQMQGKPSFANKTFAKAGFGMK